MTFECGCKNNELIISLQSELDFYKNEHEKLREKIDEITQFNAAPCNDDTYKTFIQANADFQTYKKTSTDAINNLKGQIQYIDTERLTYYNLWKISQQTICNLEAEIDQYLKQSNNPDSVQQLANQIRASEQKIIELRHEIDSGKTIEMSLAKSKSICEAQMNALDKKYNDLAIEHKEVLAQLKNMENVLRENRFEMVEIRKERDEYKKQMKSLSELHKQYQVRETVAHTKIQDALHMVEAALAEKHAALQREKEIRDECDQLALTIGRVMEEAGEKVEVNIDEIKSNYAQRLQKFEDIIKKLIVSKETLAKNNHLSKKQLHEMQTSVSDIMSDNKRLNVDLETASKTIVELEMKLKAYEKLIACEQATSKECEDRSNQLRTLLDNNIKLKQKWRDSYHEMTESMKRELVHLQSENSRLITENQKLNKELFKRNKS
ncbi:interactor of constitutive active ROPs 2, chloroplastic-like [Contarinia nasturtii]|uniref:interactor of constitutive active ROPs 2, chloroplastic-like n=1 Tax=Contarinia nasturtii TaxID=265458 RepID=UPI0012D3AB35|nr:interactor of constitutive active ROPs 2, chloroplastic-like [Contarinia nasturtii]